MNDNEQLITNFYTAFNNRDYQGMQACYADNIHFSDMAFPDLNGGEAKAMWHMLVGSSKDIKVEFKNVKADDKHGSADWIATYTFTTTGNKVINVIHAEFDLENGKIVRHKDAFEFYKWASQAFGLTGKLIGWTGFFKNKVQTTAGGRLKAFIEKNEQYQ